MSTFFFSFQQAGGANALYPLIQHLAVQDHKTLIFGRAPACRALQAHGVACNSYDDLNGPEENRLNELKTAFTDAAPDTLITDTIDLKRTDDGIICRHFWQWAKQLNIPSIAYMDCWWGFKRRFILPGEAAPPVLPDKIAVVDGYAKKMIIESGFPPETIAVTGSPRLERLGALGMDTGKEQIAAQKRQWGLPEDHFILTFASQPIEKTFRNSPCGFTEKTTIKAIIKALNSLSKNKQKKLSLLILLHPEEIPQEIKTLINNQNHDFDIIIKNKFSPEILLASDLVTGMSSILLLEALVMKRPVLSIQLGLKMEEILITNRLNVTKKITQTAELFPAIQSALSHKKYRQNLLTNQGRFRMTSTSVTQWVTLLQKVTK